MWIDGQYFICQAAGVLMIVGTLWLIFKEKLFIDMTTKQVVFVELPILGKIKTNAPSFAICVLGFIAVLYPPYVARTKYLKVQQHISSSNHPVIVYAVVAQSVQQNDGDYSLSLPMLSDPDYDPQLVYVAGPITNNLSIDRSKQKGGVISLQPQSLQDQANQLPTSDFKPNLVPVPEAFK